MNLVSLQFVVTRSYCIIIIGLDVNLSYCIRFLHEFLFML